MNNGIHKKIIFLIVMPVVLVGCSHLTINQSEVSAPLPIKSVQRIQLSRVMQYYEQLQKKTEQALVREFTEVEKRFLSNRNKKDRTKYTLLLSLPNTSFHNTQSALELLEEWPQKAKLSNDTNSLKKLLVLLLKEQQYLNIKLHILSHNLNDERIRAEALQKQVDDIKDMEKSLIRRNMN